LEIWRSVRQNTAKWKIDRHSRWACQLGKSCNFR